MHSLATLLADSSLPAPLWGLLAIWLFVLGASIGSFMNVVVYRLPAGLSLVHPGSRCPKCKTPLAARDNVPIFGWLWLRGRCRYCGLAISPRYPLVELLVACMFALLAAVGPLADGANLPGFAGRAPAEAAIDWAPWSAYAYHLFLLCVLICAALIEFDGHAIPPTLWMSLLLVGAAAPVLCPELHPVPSGVLPPEALLASPWAAGLVDGLAGFAAGFLLGLAARPAAQRAPSQPRDIALALAGAGLFLGWQAAAGLAAATAMALFALTLLGRVWQPALRAGWLGCLAPLALAWIALWRPIASQCDFLASGANVGTFVAAAIVVGAISWLIGRLKLRV